MWTEQTKYQSFDFGCTVAAIGQIPQNIASILNPSLDIFQRIERVHRSRKCNVGSPTSITENMEAIESPVKFCYSNNNDFQNLVPSLQDNELSCGLGQLDLQSIEDDCSPRIVLNRNI